MIFFDLLRIQGKQIVYANVIDNKGLICCQIVPGSRLWSVDLPRSKAGTFGGERTCRSRHLPSPAGPDFSAPDLAIAPRPRTARKANAAGKKKILGRPIVATPRAPVRPPRALLTAVELMKIAEAVATAVGSNRCAAMMPSDAKIPQTPPIRI